jgi:hypothetical protein
MDNLRPGGAIRWKVLDRRLGWSGSGVGKLAPEGCSPHLCQLRTDGLAPVSKY